MYPSIVGAGVMVSMVELGFSHREAAFQETHSISMFTASSTHSFLMMDDQGGTGLRREATQLEMSIVMYYIRDLFHSRVALSI